MFLWYWIESQTHLKNKILDYDWPIFPLTDIFELLFDHLILHLPSLLYLLLKSHSTGEVFINALQKEDVIVSTSSACSSKQTKTSHVLKAMHLLFKKILVESYPHLMHGYWSEDWKRYMLEWIDILKMRRIFCPF